MEKCLLIGNGLNRCLQDSISWGDLLSEVCDKLGVAYNKNISMPLEYERIINSHLAVNPSKRETIYDETKAIIAKSLSRVRLPEDAIHRRILEIDVQAILTTNYDYLLEFAYNPSYTDKGTHKKYIPEATSTQHGISFYHPHGIASRKTSLCLGYEHYMGIVEKIRKALNTKENNDKNKMLIKQIIYGERQAENTWYERFYTSNIAIVGLGLTECEFDLWWLLTHRAFLYYSDYCGLKKIIQNSIVFYDIIRDTACSNTFDEGLRSKEASDKANRHMLLENEHVFVKKYYLSQYNNSYTEAFSAILTSIKEHGF